MNSPHRPRDRDLPYPHDVYRIFDRDGQLLYVGCARFADARIYMHVAAWHASWPSMQMFGCMATYTVETYPTKEAARAAERAAIALEMPLYNRQHNPKRWKRIGGEWVCLIPFAEPPRHNGSFRAMPRLVGAEVAS